MKWDEMHRSDSLIFSITVIYGSLLHRPVRVGEYTDCFALTMQFAHPFELDDDWSRTHLMFNWGEKETIKFVRVLSYFVRFVRTKTIFSFVITSTSTQIHNQGVSVCLSRQTIACCLQLKIDWISIRIEIQEIAALPSIKSPSSSDRLEKRSFSFSICH